MTRLLSRSPRLSLIAALSAMLLAFALIGPVPATPPEGHWTEDLQAGLRLAKQNNRPVLVMFSASWCGPCNRMKKEVFTDDRVQRELVTWVPVYIDGDRQRELMSQYKVEAFPTFVILTPDGRESGRFVGGVGADTFINNINILLTDLPRLQRQIDQAPNDPALWKKRGNLLEKVGDIEGAVKAFEKAAGLDPQNKTGAATDVEFFKAARVGEDGPQGADRRFAEFIRRHPQSPRAEDALFNRVRIAFDDRRFDDVRALVAQYRRSYPNGKYIREARGIVDYLERENPPAKAAPEQKSAPQ